MLVLASSSKARRSLLDQICIPYQVIASGLDETKFQSEDCASLVKTLSYEKAHAVAKKLIKSEKGNTPKGNTPLESISCVLGCDSVFVFEGEIFGKPKDSKQAIERLERMSSKSGHIFTGHSLLFQSEFNHQEDQIVFSGLVEEVISTRVTFADLTQSEIESYVASGEPLNCAGCFALEGRGASFIREIEGCYSNVIGLSLPWLMSAMKEIRE